MFLNCHTYYSLRFGTFKISELLELGGKRIAGDVAALNPVFDITPADLIDFLVTEKGVIDRPDAEKMAQLMCRKRLH